jgi:hypothetical protein
VLAAAAAHCCRPAVVAPHISLLKLLLLKLLLLL